MQWSIPSGLMFEVAPWLSVRDVYTCVCVCLICKLCYDHIHQSHRNLLGGLFSTTAVNPISLKDRWSNQEEWPRKADIAYKIVSVRDDIHMYILCAICRLTVWKEWNGTEWRFSNEAVVRDPSRMFGFRVFVAIQYGNWGACNMTH